MNRHLLLALWLVGCSELAPERTPAGDDVRGGDTDGTGQGAEESCRRAIEHIRTCGYIGAGAISCAESTACEMECFSAADCQTLGAYFCNYGGASDAGLIQCQGDCGRFHCDDGTNIRGGVCDGYDDCPDGSDETRCNELGFACADNGFVPMDWVCDGDDDCADASDEEGCPDPETFRCANGEIIDAWAECDFDEDCDDASDEHSGCAPLVCF